MNWLDIILIIVFLIFFIGGLIISICAFKDDEFEIGMYVLVFALFFSGIALMQFIVLDRGSGSTIGTITSVDKNFFGTTALYVKTSETEQEKYCIEDKDVAEQAKELIGKKVKISYGERVGLYSTGNCSQAPVESIEEMEEEK